VLPREVPFLHLMHPGVIVHCHLNIYSDEIGMTLMGIVHLSARAPMLFGMSSPDREI
jgi:hypothetical protein